MIVNFMLKLSQYPIVTIPIITLQVGSPGLCPENQVESWSGLFYDQWSVSCMLKSGSDGAAHRGREGRRGHAEVHPAEAGPVRCRPQGSVRWTDSAVSGGQERERGGLTFHVKHSLQKSKLTTLLSTRRLGGFFCLLHEKVLGGGQIVCLLWKNKCIEGVQNMGKQ